MALSARLIKGSVPQLPCAPIPECVITYFGDDFAVTGDASVSATIGIFTITQLERNVQIMIPSYDFCIPRKECKPESDDPCEVFSRVDFPNLVASMSGHAKGSVAFARYRVIDDDMKKSLVELIQ